MAGINSPHVIPIASAATVRRKPTITYQSPAANVSSLYLEREQLSPSSSHATSSSSSPSSSSLRPSSIGAAPTIHPSPVQTRESKKSPLSPASTTYALSSALAERLTFHAKHPRLKSGLALDALLPLYHPLGPFALSLPDLDPSAFGLPAPPATIFDDDDPERRVSTRVRRPAPKLRDAAADDGSNGRTSVSTRLRFASVSPGPSPSPIHVQTASHTHPHPLTHVPVPIPAPIPGFTSVSTSVFSVEQEVEQASKPNSRKRRNGASGKRKRRDVDDGDIAYPAKRSRHPRASALATTSISVPLSASGDGNGSMRVPSVEADGEREPSVSASVPHPNVGGANVADGVDEVVDGDDAGEEKQHGQRKTRGMRAQTGTVRVRVRRGSRSGSTTSEATVTSLSVSVAAGGGAGDDADTNTKQEKGGGEETKVDPGDDEGAVSVSREAAELTGPLSVKQPSSGEVTPAALKEGQ